MGVNNVNIVLLAKAHNADNVTHAVGVATVVDAHGDIAGTRQINRQRIGNHPALIPVSQLLTTKLSGINLRPG